MRGVGFEPTTSRSDLRKNEKKALGLDFGSPCRVGQTKLNRNVSVVQGIRNWVPLPNFRIYK